VSHTLSVFVVMWKIEEIAALFFFLASDHVITLLFKCSFFVVVRRNGDEHSCSAFWPCHPSFYVFLSLSLHQEAVKIILILLYDLVTLLFTCFFPCHCMRKCGISVAFCFLTTSLFWVFVSLFVGEWKKHGRKTLFCFRTTPLPSFYVFLSLSLHREVVKIILVLLYDLVTLLFMCFFLCHCVRKCGIAVAFCFLTTSLSCVFVSSFVGEWRNIKEQLGFAFGPRHSSFFMCFSFVVVWRNEEEQLYFSFQTRHNYFTCFFLCCCVKKNGESQHCFSF